MRFAATSAAAPATRAIVESIRAAADACEKGDLVIPPRSRYARASTLDHALELLAEPDAKAIAGGQSLLPVMKLRIARPSLLVDIGAARAARCRGSRRRTPHRAADDLGRAARAAELARPALAALARVRARDRRPSGAQPRHDRRQPRARRSRLRHAGGPPRARREAPASVARRASGRSLLERLPPRARSQPRSASRSSSRDIVVPMPARGFGLGVRRRRAPCVGLRARRRGRTRRAGRERERRAHRRRRDAVRPRAGVDPLEAIASGGDVRRRLRTGGVPPRARASSSPRRALDAAPRARAEADAMTDTYIGVARPRIDAPEKVTGATRYAADGTCPRPPPRAADPRDRGARTHPPRRHAKLRSPYPASSPSCSPPTSRSRRRAPTARPSRSRARRSSSPASRSRSSSPRTKQPPRTAPSSSSSSTSRSRRSSTSRQRWCPVRRSPAWSRRPRRAATSSRSTPASTTARRTTDEEQLSGNVLDRVHRSSGDVAAAFEASDVVVSGTFRTPWIYQAYIEPQVATAWLEPSGTLVVSTSTQGSFVTRRRARTSVRAPARADPRDR